MKEGRDGFGRDIRRRSHKHAGGLILEAMLPSNKRRQGVNADMWGRINAVYYGPLDVADGAAIALTT